MKVRFTAQATKDLADIADYVRTRNPEASQRVRAAILDSLQILATFPELGRRQDVEGVRKLVTRRFPYLVYYTIDVANEEVILLSIQHPAREREKEGREKRSDPYTR
jgi:addiction module RelE/StbE family toxin